jgi:dihydrolipoamide dehydrogenase
MENYDVIVLGAGPGGYPAAIRAAQLGNKVAIIEREEAGGTCLNWGCIPTKTLIAASSLYEACKHSEKYGIKISELSCDYSAMTQRKDDVVLKLRNGIQQLLKANAIALYNGEASFISRNRINIKTSEQNKEIQIEGKRIIIATGAKSSMPAFLPKSDRVLDSKSFLALKQLPKSLIVLGGGIIGCEIATLAAQLGCKVTIVEILEDILFNIDKDARTEVRRFMENELKIKIFTGKPLENISATRDKIAGTVDTESIKAEFLLAALGRAPETEPLQLANAGVKTDKKGFVVVDEIGQTSAATVYAAGDVTGGIQLAHYATYQGIQAAEAASGKRLTKKTCVPSCIFTTPEIGTVGLTEDDAKKSGKQIKVGKFPFAALGKALAIGETNGFVKWIADAETDRLLGAVAVGPHATELIAEGALAIEAEMTAKELAYVIHSHPTLSEAWMEAAHALHNECIHLAPKRKSK